MTKKPDLELIASFLQGNSNPLLTPNGQLSVAKPSPLRYIVAEAAEIRKSEEDAPIRKANDPSLNSPLAKSILNSLNGGSRTKNIESLAFERDPGQTYEFATIFRPKQRLTPDTLLKRIAIQDDLIAAILHARGSHISQFGREPEDRFSIGYKIVPDASLTEDFDENKKQELQKRIDRAGKLLLTCGSSEKVKVNDRCSLSDYLYQTVRNGLMVGRAATEVRWTCDMNGERAFHSWRPIDAATIYFAANHQDSAQQVRDQAKKLLEQLRNEKFDPERFEAGEYEYVQVIEGKPLQAFTSDEMLVHNFYPVTDWELGGYPLTPIDTMLAAVTTHINITNHNKAYFQSGRASRGMLVIKSGDVNLQLIEAMKQQFNAAINGVQNAWRMPVFGCGPDDDITWQPIDQGTRDMEFQYLSDTNARVILSAFQMSPEELPGYQHLCVSRLTHIWTESGLTTIGELLGDSLEVGGFRIWTGKHWADARAFVTGERSIRRTTTGNGITLTTSPEHRFKVVGETGIPVWKQQRDLKAGDTLLINRKPLDGREENIPAYRGKKLTVEMAEILGWLTGDGSITVRKAGKIKHSKNLEFYYHHDKEKEIRERHFAAMLEFGLSPKLIDREMTVSAVEKQKKAYGFKSVSSVRRMIHLYDTEFVEWLLALGFTQSSDRKTIPSFIHGLPIEFRGAFLRGFFSADGTKDKLNTPSIAIYDDSVRAETKLLLLNMGIRTRSCEGTVRKNFYKEDNQIKAELVEEPSRLIVKDKIEFYRTIGFLQSHKQPNWNELQVSDCRWDKVARSVAIRLADQLLAIPGQNSLSKDTIRHLLKDPKYDYQVRSKLENIAGLYGIELSDWINDYYQEPIVSIENADDELIEMVDVEVFDEEHAFMADGVLVHNSRGTNNQSLCLNVRSGILTEDGFKTIEVMLDGAGEVNTRIWTGKDWADARVFLTDEKRNILTTLWNGSRIETSSDHRFLAIGPEGKPMWVRQKALRVGDCVLVNKQPVKGIGEIPSYNDKYLTEDMMEVLGWLTGDGNISVRFNKNTGNIKQGALSWFYHHEKEVDLWEKHSKILSEFGFSVKHENHTVSDLEAADLKDRYGFKTVASNRLRNRLYDTDFVRWLLSLGFQSSTDGKVIPDFLHVLPIGHRAAFLRGFFSADGTKTSSADGVRIVIHNNHLRQQTRNLLMGLGIRTQFHEGLLKQDVDGINRKMVPGQSTLAIKDKTAFYERIGFLQDHKQPSPEILSDSERKWERVPGVVVEDILFFSKFFPNLPRVKKDGCSLSTLENYCKFSLIPVPEWLYDYHIEEIVSIEDSGEVVQMADVEVFDNFHAFVANGVIVHNSESNNEYKLEAARDVGIRPLLSQIEDFVNTCLMPLIDEPLSRLAKLKFVGLDKDTPEKESVRLQQDAPIHGTMNWILEKVEKDPVPKEMGGDFPLNQEFQESVVKPYLTFGQIQEYYFGVQGGSQRPDWQFYQNADWFNWMNMQLQQQQMQQQQVAMGGQPGQDDGSGGDSGPPQGEDGGSPPTNSPSPGGDQPAAKSELSTGIDQLIQMMAKSLGKSEKNLSQNKLKLKAQHKVANKHIMDQWESDSKKALSEIADLAERHAPTKKD